MPTTTVSQTAVTTSAPGKLILSGEHAVVYGRPALVAAADLRLTTRLRLPSPGAAPHLDAPVRLRVPVLQVATETTWREILNYADATRMRWQAWMEESEESTEEEGRAQPFAQVRADDPDHLLKVALGETARALGDTAGPPLEVDVESDLPTGCGFGSSAAAAVSLVAAYLELRGAEYDPTRIEALALDVERRQHGAPSGVDGATVLHGGFVWAQPREGTGLVIEPFDPAVRSEESPLAGLAVYDTGRPAEGTGTVVATVRQRWRSEPARYEALWDEMAATTQALRRLLSGSSSAHAEGGATLGTTAPPEHLSTLFQRSQRALEAIGVVPKAVRTLVRTVEAAGGAAKISGAGSLAGPGAGTLLVHHPELAQDPDSSVLDEIPPLRLLRRLPVRLGGPGLRFENQTSSTIAAPRETP